MRKLIYFSNYVRLPPPNQNQQLNFEKVLTVHSYSTRQARAIQVPRFSTAKCQRSFKYIGAKIWNNTSYELKDYPKDI